jgi:hypothetical protein
MRVIDWVLPSSIRSKTAPRVIGQVARVNGGNALQSSPPSPSPTIKTFIVLPAVIATVGRRV